MSPIKPHIRPRRSIPSIVPKKDTITTTTTTITKTSTRISKSTITSQTQHSQGQDSTGITHNEVELGHAGPSSSNHASSSRLDTSLSEKSRNDVKGKGKEKEKPTERRVLPARIRRSAGGGEGMRDLEEMIMDWLERCSEPSTTPPDDLPIHITSIPLSYVDPPTFEVTTTNQPDGPPVTLTPSRRKSTINDDTEGGKLGKEEKIEVPDWVMVKAGEDDQEEAREELVFGDYNKANGSGNAVGRGIMTSPVKRTRRGGIGDEVEEDTSDSYYMALHKKYEIFEKRQRIREKEKLQFERYKMKSRLDLLENLPKLTWSMIVSTILSRFNPLSSQSQTKDPTNENTAEEADQEQDKWFKGRLLLKGKGDEWLREQLIIEGQEVMERFEQLLPPEQKKPKNPSSTPHQSESRLSTPSRISSSPSLTPPPAVLPARVAALRDSSSGPTSNKRKRRSTVTSIPNTPIEKSNTAAPTSEDAHSRRTGERRSTRATRASRGSLGSDGVAAAAPGAEMLPSTSDKRFDGGGSDESEDPDWTPAHSQEVNLPSASKSRETQEHNSGPRHVPTIRAPVQAPPTNIPKQPTTPLMKSGISPNNQTQLSIKSFFTRANSPSFQADVSVTAPRPITAKPLLPSNSPAAAAANSTSTGYTQIRTSLTTPLTTTTTAPTTGPAATVSISHPKPRKIVPSTTKQASHPPTAGSGLPCLIEAAARREHLEQSIADPPESSKVLPQDHANRLHPGSVNSKLPRSGGQSSKKVEDSHNLNPFGVALPGRLEWKSEFTISNEEDFWPIIANRDNQRRELSMLSKSNGIDQSSQDGTSPPQPQPQPPYPVQQVQIQSDADSFLTPEEVEELEGVEAAVVL